MRGANSWQRRVLALAVLGALILAGSAWAAPGGVRIGASRQARQTVGSAASRGDARGARSAGPRRSRRALYVGLAMTAGMVASRVDGFVTSVGQGARALPTGARGRPPLGKRSGSSARIGANGGSDGHGLTPAPTEAAVTRPPASSPALVPPGASPALVSTEAVLPRLAGVSPALVPAGASPALVSPGGTGKVVGLLPAARVEPPASAVPPAVYVVREGMARQRRQRVWLKCPERGYLARQIAAIQAWTRRVGEKPAAVEPEYDGRDGLWRADVTDAMPARARAHEGVAPPVDGPNCWATALYVNGVLDHYRHATNQEIKHQTEGAPFCRRRAAGEALEPGDIVTIRQPPPRGSVRSFDDTHAYTYISPSLVFSKNSARRDNLAGLQTTAQIYDEYQVAPERRRLGQVDGPGRGARSRSDLWDNAYASVPLGAFVRTHPEYQVRNLPKDLRQALRTTAKYEKMITADAWNQIEMSPVQRKRFKRTANDILIRADRKLAHADRLEEAHRFYWQTIQDKWMAFYAQRMATDIGREQAARVRGPVVAISGSTCTLRGQLQLPRLFGPQVVGVEVSIDDSRDWRPAQGTRNWMFRCTLPAGRHSARIRAVTDDGRVGPPAGPLAFDVGPGTPGGG